MCSIAGIVHPEDMASAVAAAEAMNQAQVHRGPDGGGVWHDQTAVLAHRRLSIIDLAGGRQPMGNEDGSIQVVFNGEVYNHAALRAELEKRGHVFQSRCDTEVLLHLYEEKGDAFVRELDGMFAFALWDAPRHKLLLARDRAGQKPLHYFFRNGTLVFASELAALKTHPDFPHELSQEAVSDYLSLQYVPSPRTVYKNVFKLSPGTLLRFDPETGSAEPERYWSLKFQPKLRISAADAAAELHRLVTSAVRKRLMADVPFGVFLSGGVDSAVIAGCMAELRAPQITEAFTIGFDDPAYDERAGARLTADWINRRGKALELHEKVVSGDDFDFCMRLFAGVGEPYADASLLPTALLSCFARESVTMALSGDAADELFAGYERYLAMKIARVFNLVPGPLRKGVCEKLWNCLPDDGERTRAGRLRRLLRTLSRPADRQYFSLLDRFPAADRAELAGERLTGLPESGRVFDFPHTARDAAEQCMETDFHCYLESDTLLKVDRASMAASLEVRDPFLDREVVEFATSLPMAYKLHGKSRKHILREAFKAELAPETAAGKKRGFGIPLAGWLRNAWREPAREVLFSGRLFAEGWVRREALEKMFAEHQSGRADRSYILFNLLVFARFLQDA